MMGKDFWVWMAATVAFVMSIAMFLAVLTSCHDIDLVIVRGPGGQPLAVTVASLEVKTPPWPCKDIFTFQPMWFQRMARMWELRDPQLHDLWKDGIQDTTRRCAPDGS